MRGLLQRVIEAKVIINGEIYSSINKGMLLFLGVERSDTTSDLDWLLNKIIQMRIFSDEKGQLNYSIKETEGEIMVVSQFTLFASTKKGNRPGFTNAALPEKAKDLYLKFVSEVEKNSGCRVKTGVFGADMKVYLINDGPVTIFIDSRNKE